MNIFYLYVNTPYAIQSIYLFLDVGEILVDIPPRGERDYVGLLPTKIPAVILLHYQGTPGNSELSISSMSSDALLLSLFDSPSLP